MEGSSLLELFAELCEALSHRGRSSLTVVGGALGDLESGYELSAEDVADARSSVAQLGREFDLLRELGQELRSADDGHADRLTHALHMVRG